ncbi:hypothetical protein ABZX64_15655 [Streptomyces misionensis]
MTHVEDELTSQPACWTRAAEEAGRHRDALPAPGERVAVAAARGLDPDRPRHLTRSVILTPDAAETV